MNSATLADSRKSERQDYDVDALRLLRLVRIRRGLRLLTRISLTAIPLWIAAILVSEEELFTPNWIWEWVEEHIGVGFLVIVGVLVLAALVQFALRFLRRAGRVAAKLVPQFGRGGTEVVIGEDVHITRTEEGRYSPTYFLSSPYGEVVAENDPEPGEHFIVTSDDGLGNGRAYQVGGFAFLQIGALALAGLILAGAPPIT